MSEILSQEQIDSLLGQKDTLGIGADNAADSSASQGGEAKNYDALQKAFALFDEQAGTVVSTILNKTVSFEAATCEKTTPDKVKTTVEAPALLITIPFKAGLTGDMRLLLAKKDVAHTADLMMMGDGSAAYTDDHKDAIVELLSQVMGAFTTALGGKIGEHVGVDTISASDFDAAAPSFSIDESDCAVLSCSLGDAGTFSGLLTVSDELSGQLMHAMNAGSASEDSHEEDDSSGSFGSAGLDGANAGKGDSFVETTLSGDSVRTSSSHENIDMLLDVELDVYIELGRSNLSIKRILELSPGSIVELDRMAGEPVDLLVNDKVVAKGEVVVVDENFGIRIVSLVSAEDRIKSLK